MLRASIVNRATYAQPFPLLRLTLQDRFGGTLGQGDIGPADYLPGAGGGGLLGPGERADALIRIVDPGAEAVGFELDICLPAKGGVRCANQIKTAAPMKIGPYEIAAPLALAPMAGVTDLPFRRLCRSMGAGIAASEMVTSDLRLWNTPKTRQRLDHRGEPEPRVVQIAGYDPA